MPYEIRRVDGEFCVFKQGTDKRMGCHPSRARAERQMRALYANVQEATMTEAKAAWSSAYITALPDSAFACVDSSGRHYPHHDASGKLDLPHLRNALSRIAQSGTATCGASHLEAHARAQGVGKAEPIKAEQLGTARWRVLAIPFGGPLKGGRDLDGEYFSPRTDTKPTWFKERPVLFHHGQDSRVGSDDVGIEDDLTKETDGWWARLWLDRQSAYFAELDALIRAGKMYGSSGSMAHLVRKAHDGEILVWPHVEQTLTLTPANVFSRITASKALDDFTTAGIELDPAVRDVLTEPDVSDLGADLPEGGEDPALARLASTLSQLERVLKGLAR